MRWCGVFSVVSAGFRIWDLKRMSGKTKRRFGKGASFFYFFVTFRPAIIQISFFFYRNTPLYFFTDGVLILLGHGVVTLKF